MFSFLEILKIFKLLFNYKLKEFPFFEMPVFLDFQWPKSFIFLRSLFYCLAAEVLPNLIIFALFKIN